MLDTAYTSIAPGTYSGHLPFTSGLEFADAPDTSYTLGFQHTANIESGGTFVTRLDYNYQGQFWRSEPFLRVSGYAAVPDELRGERRLGPHEPAVDVRAGGWGLGRPRSSAPT